MYSEHGPAASAEASQQKSGGLGTAATDGAFHWMNGEQGLGASGGASRQTSGGPGFSGLDGFGRCPLHTGLVGWGGMWFGVMVDVEAGQNETAAYDGGGSGGPAAVVLGASYKEDG